MKYLCRLDDSNNHEHHVVQRTGQLQDERPCSLQPPRKLRMLMSGDHISDYLIISFISHMKNSSDSSSSASSLGPPEDAIRILLHQPLITHQTSLIMFSHRIQKVYIRTLKSGSKVIIPQTLYNILVVFLLSRSWEFDWIYRICFNFFLV